MKKKWIVLGSAVGISSVIMATTGIAALAGTSGYDDYKSAFKATHALNSVSVQASAVVQDNGSQLVQAKGSVKADLANRNGSGTVDVAGSGTEHQASFYKQGNQVVWHTDGSDVYYVQQEKHHGGKHAGEYGGNDIPQQVETVIDTLVGNLKNYVTTDTMSDGTKEVSIQLENGQIPALVNTIAPIIIKKASEEHGKGNRPQNEQGEFVFSPELAANAPKLTQDIRIQKIALKADINSSNYIQHQEADITVSGKDAGGAAHELTLHVSADMSSFNATTPDQVDLSGKNVKQVQHGHEGKFEHHD